MILLGELIKFHCVNPGEPIPNKSALLYPPKLYSLMHFSKLLDSIGVIVVIVDLEPRARTAGVGAKYKYEWNVIVKFEIHV